MVLFALNGYNKIWEMFIEIIEKLKKIYNPICAA
jgi:hypothetical protein